MNLDAHLQTIEATDPMLRYGKVTQIIGLIIESIGPADVAMGEICLVGDPHAHHIEAEVVGFRGERVLLMPLGEIEGIRPETEVFPTRSSLQVPVGETLKGRIIDGLGKAIDGEGPIHTLERRHVHSVAPDPLQRSRVSESIGTGVRAIDGMASIGKGQRLGIFSGSGVGKSTLLGMISRNSEADVNVIALVGERGKEVLDFIEDSLGPQGLQRSVVIVATSEQPALIRLKAAFTATTIAEYFREQGQNVVLMMDSLTRVAMAQREIGLAAGEPPTTKGYTPSVFALLPRLLERAGSTKMGSITGLYTVLVEGDEMDDPIADSARAILDGHIVLSRRLASRGHYPPIDVMESISRSMKDVSSDAHWERAMEIKGMMAAYAEAEDLVNIGAYARGSNPRIDRALDYIEPIEQYLRQGGSETGSFDHHVQRLMGLLSPPAPVAE
ncbi:MAG: FliI/YscN family ATPase [Gemmatimonadetes bacterium]|jgi:flagellum-specific ATP synthase|nr:FliI/YscN family ATPase [Gemmatimonadota bacterium]MBT6148563.1 FliI/YscN family ATPase [Gemmatimonadota bacterium]MBT7862874.1 FliI/YscN family ATPase [Gemmatimonadota bacterium]